MKKIISVLGIVIIFLSIYFLQSNFFSWFNIYSIKPNLFMIFVIFLGLFLGKEYGLTFGILLGLIPRFVLSSPKYSTKLFKSFSVLTIFSGL